ncbi:13941_t:CDS:2, partial [Dentiscutata erythropus]
DRITLSKLQLDQKHFYKVLQIKSAKLPFSFDESELKNTQKELKKLTCSTVRSWLLVPNNIATWEGVGITYEG